MPTKKIKDAIEMTKRELGIEDDVVDDLANYFYFSLRKQLSSLQSPSIQVKGLGLFRINYKQLKALITKERKQYGRMKDEKARSEILTKILHEEEVFKEIEKNYFEKNEFYERKKQVKKDYYKQRQNNRGAIQHLDKETVC